MCVEWKQYSFTRKFLFRFSTQSEFSRKWLMMTSCVLIHKFKLTCCCDDMAVISFESRSLLLVHLAKVSTEASVGRSRKLLLLGVKDCVMCAIQSSAALKPTLNWWSTQTDGLPLLRKLTTWAKIDHQGRVLSEYNLGWPLHAHTRIWIEYWKLGQPHYATQMSASERERGRESIASVDCTIKHFGPNSCT